MRARWCVPAASSASCFLMQPLTACFAAQEEASAALPGNMVLATPLNEVRASASGEELADWGGQWRKPGGK